MRSRATVHDEEPCPGGHRSAFARTGHRSAFARTDLKAIWQVEATTDGVNWNPVGDAFTPPATDDVETFFETVGLAGKVRVRIRSLATGQNNRRMNIDDIRMSDFP